MRLSEQEQQRYSRHLSLDGFTQTHQAMLRDASVLAIGAGGLGSSVLTYLAAAGIGRLGIIDHDRVAESNLNRQILFESGDIGRSKAQSAKDRLSELNPKLTIDVFEAKLDEPNAASLVSDHDVIADGCDNFETRLLVNREAYKAGKSLVSAALAGYAGQLMVVNPTKYSPCYQCLVSSLPSQETDCDALGILGPVCGVMGSLQAIEIIKLITGLGTPLTGQWLRYDARDASIKKSQLTSDPDCPVCGLSR